MSSILSVLTDALRDARTGDPQPVPKILDSIPENPLGVTVSSWDDIQQFLAGWDALQEAVRDTLAVRLLQQRFPRLAEALVLFGGVRITYVANSDPIRVDSFTIVWERIKQLLNTYGASADDLQWWLSKATNPEKLKALIVLLVASPDPLLKLEYANDGFQSLPGVPQSVDLVEIINRLVNSPATITLPTTVHTARSVAELLAAVINPPPATFGSLSAEISPPIPPSSLAINFHANSIASLASSIVDFGAGWKARFNPDASVVPSGDYRLAWSPVGGWDGAVRSSSDLTLVIERASAEPNVVIGDEQGTRIEIGKLSATLRLSKNPSDPLFVLGLQCDRVALAVGLPPILRTFGDVVSLPPDLRFTSDIAVDYAQGKGLRLRSGESGGDGSLSVQFVHPLNLQFGGSGAGLKIDTINVRLVKAIETRDFRVEFRTAVHAEIGPLRLTANGAGALFGIAGSSATVGPIQPTGIGIVVEAGPIRGGGFLDIQTTGGLTRYAGALSLKLLFLDVFAFGILEERQGGGLSFVAVLGIRFPAGIQLGFGFMITGVGGIVGIHRRMNLELLRDRLASGAAGNVLFCDDPTRNAPMILGDLAAFFPAEEGSFIVGPTLQLGWLYLVRLDVALIIELPGPQAIVIAGTGRVLIGASEELALIFLRMDFIGGIDVRAELIFFDAALVNSHVLGILEITGGMAFRVAYGSNSYVALSVGGFHPSFNPAPMSFPPLARAGTSLSLSVVAEIWMRTQMYVAFTSNTFQVGSAVEAGLRLGPLSAHGWFHFDALIQFKPFYFQADIDAGFEIEVGDVSIASARVQGHLSGPGPITIRARASVKVLFVRVSGSVTLELGPKGGETEIRLPSAYPIMLAELNSKNMRSEGDDPDVILRADRSLKGASTQNAIMALPNGRVIWEQKLAPLKTDLQRFRGQLLEQNERYTVTCAGLPDDESDEFAIGTFATLSPAESLNNTLFQPLPSGLQSKEGAINLSGAETPSIETDLTIVPDFTFLPFVLNPGSHFIPAILSEMAAQRSSVPPINGGPGKVSMKGETWKAVDANGDTVVDAKSVSPVQAFLKARGAKGFAVAVTDGALNLADV